MTTHHYAACDLGAESGRVIVGILSDGRLTLEEIHRFPTGAFRIGNTLRWNILRIFEDLKTGLQIAVQKYPGLTSLSVDSWGVDYAWFSPAEPLIALPYQYRDPRTEAHYPKALAEDGDLIFSETGIQFMSINTLYHLIDDQLHRQDVLGISSQFLNIADYLHYLFCGVARAEESLASTTQLYNPVTRSWSEKLIAHYGFPARLFPQIVPSGTSLGPVRPEIEAGSPMVVATCSHDTAASFAAVPAGETDDWACLSSGTWSLIGVELEKPLINDAVRAANFTNEVGYGGSIRFLKNIVGLWIIQECRRHWKKIGSDFSYGEITQMAGDAESLRSLIYPNDDRFLRPDDMIAKVQAFCRETGQPVPETPGAVARCVYESLALLYASSLAKIEKLTGKTIRTLHIVGGGSQSALLNQFTASATGRTVIAGPIEATAIGNVLVQAIVAGQLTDLSALRQTVRDSFPTTTHQPQNQPDWQNALQRFSALSTLN